MRFIEHKVNLMCRAGFLVSCVLVPLLALLVFFGTIARLFGVQVLGIFEVSALLVGIIVFLSFGYVLLRGQHIVVRVITERLPARVSSVVHIVMTVLSLAWVIPLFIGSCITWEYFLSGNVMIGSLLDIPMWIPAISMIVGTGLLVLRSLFEIVKSITEYNQQKQKIESVQGG